jgi:PTS system mannose-specific IIC component
MAAAGYLMAAAVAVFSGLDRTAFLQLMISRPIVAAPLTGWLLGDPMAGLQAGAMVELLWLGRLPVGAAIPPDDTQVAIGSTVLAITMGNRLDLAGPAFVILCTLVALPLGKVGQLFERWARDLNGRLLQKAQDALAEGRIRAAEQAHLWGIGHFALASLATFITIIVLGSLLLSQLAPMLMRPVTDAAPWLRVAFPVMGTAIILSSINVRRSLTLFTASFTSALLMLWLL